jgi:SAM-dependent methyltransferase
LDKHDDRTPSEHPSTTPEVSWVAEMPGYYDRCLGPAVFAPFAAYLAAAANGLSPTSVLELASGTGVVTAELVRALPQAHITATDLSEAMVTWGRDHVPGAAWQLADAQALPFDDGTFDLVVCQFGVMFFPDKPGAFAEAARVLKPGSTMLFAVWDVVAKSTFAAALSESLEVVLPNDPPSFLMQIPHGYNDAVQIASDVAAGGLELIEIAPVTLPGHSPSARTVAEGFCLGTPLRFALAERGVLQTLTDAVAAEMTRILGDGPVRADLGAFVITARSPG